MNQKAPITLTIKEIAEYKEKGIIPHKLKTEKPKLQKTHDGTSSGPIRGPLASFIEENGDSQFRYTIVLDNKGEQVFGLDHLVSDKTHEEPIGEETDVIFDNTNGKDLHVITKIGRDEMMDSYVGEDPANPWFHDSSDREWSLISKGEAERLCETDEDGNYKIRSQTLVGVDGTSMTFTRNDQFNAENHEHFSELVDEFNKDMAEHESLIHSETFENLNKYAVEQGYRDSISMPHEEWEAKRLEFKAEAEAKYGDNMSYVNEIWKPRFEDECNIKLKTQYNTNVTPKKVEDYDEYAKTWELLYDEPWNGDWETYGEPEGPGGGAFSSWGDYYNYRLG